MNEDKKLPDEAVEGVSGGADQLVADLKAFVELNCTDCAFAKGGGCYYHHKSQLRAFYEFGKRPDAVCTHKFRV